MQSSLEMATDPSSMQNPDQVVWTSDEGGSSLVRSYECTFCKRGFSNAQALGGHMNIHRKDRAKLKQPSKDNQLALDITKKNPSSCPVPTGFMHETQFMWPWVIDDETHGEEIRQLPLFIDTLMSGQDRRSVSHGLCDEERTQFNHGSVGAEVDLELRLGPEPHQQMSLGYKEFF